MLFSTTSSTIRIDEEKVLILRLRHPDMNENSTLESQTSIGLDEILGLPEISSINRPLITSVEDLNSRLSE